MDNYLIEFMQFMCYLLLNYAGLFHLGASSPTTMKQPCLNAAPPPAPLRPYDKGTLDVKNVFLYFPLHLRLVCNCPTFY